ncbi:TPA: integrase arm-type DNA-binding domain-containing protein [Haemophilus influenzae]
MAVLVKPLSITEINNAKPKEKDYSLSDGQGLFLLVKMNGSKIWRFQYYKPISKKRTSISLGVYPEISLKDAREIRDLYRSLLAKNIDPQDYRLQQEQKAIQERQFTLSEMGKEWLYLKKNEVDTGRLKEVSPTTVLRERSSLSALMVKTIEWDFITENS